MFLFYFSFFIYDFGTNVVGNCYCHGIMISTREMFNQTFILLSKQKMGIAINIFLIVPIKLLLVGKRSYLFEYSRIIRENQQKYG